MIHRLRNLCLMVSATAMLIAAPAMAEPTQDVLKHVPNDAWGFAVIRSVSTIDKNIEQLQALGLPIMPGFRLGTALKEPPFALGDSADMERPICLVMLDMNKFGMAENSPPDPARAVALLVPSKDPKAIMKKFAVKEEEGGGVRKIKFLDEELYAVEKATYLVVGKSEKTVKEVSSYSGDGPPMVDARKKLLGLTDIYLSFSVDRVYNTYGMQFAPIAQMVMMQADPTGKSWQRFEKVLKELDAIDFGIRLDDKGIAIRGLVMAKKESDLELYLKDSKNFDSSKLMLLPKEDYLFAMGSRVSFSDHQDKFVDPNPLSSLMGSLQMPDFDKAAAGAIDAEVAKMTKATKAQAMSISMLSGGEGGYVGLAAVVETEKPEAYVQSLRDVYKNIWRLSTSEEFKTAKSMLTHTPDAETIDGGKVDTLSVKSKELIEEMEIAPDDVKALKTFFGEDLTIRFGAVGDKHVVITVGGGKDRYANVAKLAKSGGDSGLNTDIGIMGTSKNLADPRASEFFVSVENIMRMVKVASKEIDGEDAIPFEIPKIDAPAAMDVAAADGGLRFDLFVPMKLIDAVKKAVEEQAARDMEAFDEMDDDAMGDAGEDSGDDSADDADDDMDE